MDESQRISGRIGIEIGGTERERLREREAVCSRPPQNRWGVVLAGGDGVRLRSLTRLICGDDRPKQFCALVGECSLLDQTRQRAERSIRGDQILYSLTRAHQDYYQIDLADRASQRIVQPCNRGTAPAIVYTLLHIFQMDPDAMVAVLPCDHHYSPEWRFTTALEQAFAVAGARPDSVVLLGARPEGPEVEYGWIELGETVGDLTADVFRVRRFQEKPSVSVAERLFNDGSLWNTFIMVGHVKAFLELALESLPRLVEALRATETHLVVDRETRISDGLYNRIPATDFSRQILAPGAARLIALELGALEWNDLGHPERVISTLAKQDVRLPAWAQSWQEARIMESNLIRLAASVGE